MLSLLHSVVDEVLMEELYDWIDRGFTIVDSTVIFYELPQNILLGEALRLFNSGNVVVNNLSFATAFPDPVNRASDSTCRVKAATSTVPPNPSRATFGVPAIAAVLPERTSTICRHGFHDRPRPHPRTRLEGRDARRGEQQHLNRRNPGWHSA